MNIGVLKEVKPQEYRVVVLPQGVRRLVQRGHRVAVQSGAGKAAGFADEAYLGAGAAIVAELKDLYQQSDILVKVKEPVAEEFGYFVKGQALFCYLHSETRPALVDLLLRKQITAIAFENVKEPDGTFPLLAPMSIIAGQQAVLQGAQFLCNHRGGVGKSLVAYPGLEPPKIVVLGAGPAGVSAAETAAALGAEVALFELRPERIRELAGRIPARVRLLHSETVSLTPYVSAADMVINCATLPPNSPYHLIDRELLGKMRPGAVIVDVTANLKGAVETVDRYTTHEDPVWEVDGIIHYAVTNIPGTVAQTASQALALAVLPYLMELTDYGLLQALSKNNALRHGLTAVGGNLTWHEAGTMQDRPWMRPEEALRRLMQ